MPKGKRIAFNVGSEMVNVYSDLASIIKRNATRQEEAATLFMKAASVEESPSRTAHWYIRNCVCVRVCSFRNNVRYDELLQDNGSWKLLFTD